MAYFSTWWLHGNRVSKTQFITLIKKNKSDQNIRGQPEKKKTQKQKKERRLRSEKKKTTRTSEKMEIGVRSEKNNHQNLGCVSPGWCATQAVAWAQAVTRPRPLHEPRLSHEPRPRATQAFVRPRPSREPRLHASEVSSLSLWFESLRLGLLCSGISKICF